MEGRLLSLVSRLTTPPAIGVRNNLVLPTRFLALALCNGRSNDPDASFALPFSTTPGGFNPEFSASLAAALSLAAAARPAASSPVDARARPRARPRPAPHRTTRRPVVVVVAAAATAVVVVAPRAVIVVVAVVIVPDARGLVLLFTARLCRDRPPLSRPDPEPTPILSRRSLLALDSRDDSTRERTTPRISDDGARVDRARGGPRATSSSSSSSSSSDSLSYMYYMYYVYRHVY